MVETAVAVVVDAVTVALPEIVTVDVAVVVEVAGVIVAVPETVTVCVAVLVEAGAVTVVVPPAATGAEVVPTFVTRSPVFGGCALSAEVTATAKLAPAGMVGRLAGTVYWPVQVPFTPLELVNDTVPKTAPGFLALPPKVLVVTFQAPQPIVALTTPPRMFASSPVTNPETGSGLVGYFMTEVTVMPSPG